MVENKVVDSQEQTVQQQQVTGADIGGSVETQVEEIDFETWKNEILNEAKMFGQDLKLLTQSELDSLIQKAIKTREENLKKQELQKKGEYESLLKTERFEALKELLTTELSVNGMTEFVDLFDLQKLSEKPLGEAKEVLKEQIKRVKETVEKQIQSKLENQLKQMESDTYVNKSKPQQNIDIRNLSYEELEQLYRKNPNLFKK